MKSIILVSCIAIYIYIIYYNYHNNYYYRMKQIYWLSDIYRGDIMRSNFNGSDVTTILSNGTLPGNDYNNFSIQES